MRIRLKVCCIQSADEAELAIASGADALGLVGAMPSGPGPIPDERIAAIAKIVPPPIATFLLTSKTTANEIASHIRAVQPTAVQIVSHIAPEQAAELARLQPWIRRLQVIHVEGPEILSLIPAYAPHVHAFLLDSGRPGGEIAELGGTGRTHDWSVSAAFVRASPRPVFLAGGLTAANIESAIRQVQPFGVDLCSGVRTNGRLDGSKLAAVVAAICAAENRKSS